MATVYETESDSESEEEEQIPKTHEKQSRNPPIKVMDRDHFGILKSALDLINIDASFKFLKEGIFVLTKRTDNIIIRGYKNA